MEFVELASGFGEVFVVEFGDASLFFLHFGAAIVVQVLGCGADLVDEFGGGSLGKGEGFKASVVRVSDISF